MTRFPWFAVYTQALREQHVASLVRAKGFEEFVPLYRRRRRWSDRFKDVGLPLFPSYFFCRLDPCDRMPILMTPGVKAIVGIGRSLTPIHESEIDAIRTITTSGQVVLPWEFLQTGERVRVEEGPLRGLEGILIQVTNQYRVVASVTLLQRSVAVEVDREWVAPIRKPCCPAVYPTARVASR
jgi:transcription antitermination factor NusG